MWLIYPFHRTIGTVLWFLPPQAPDCRFDAMPLSKKKSCDPCRASKARCNRASPCSRCAERGLQCAYAPFSSPARPLRRPRRQESTLLPDRFARSLVEVREGTMMARVGSVEVDIPSHAHGYYHEPDFMDISQENLPTMLVQAGWPLDCGRGAPLLFDPCGGFPGPALGMDPLFACLNRRASRLKLQQTPLS